MSGFKLKQAQASQFEREGYIIVKDLFSSEEINLLFKLAKADKQLSLDAAGYQDKAGKQSKLSLYNELNDEIYSSIVRSKRIVNTMEVLLGGEVYHYHHKMMLKEPRVGGAWEWHQDYGYWYDNGCLYPYMASCMIAVDKAGKENGCLQVIPGSHHFGRIDHGKTGEQAGADMDRVNAALERLPLVYVELEPGSAVFFHGNLLHRSDQNTSDKSRWTLICCYNAARNDPFFKSHHPGYTKLDKTADEEVLRAGQKQWAQMKKLQAV